MKIKILKQQLCLLNKGWGRDNQVLIQKRMQSSAKSAFLFGSEEKE
jgi:hypothetical protein